MERSIRGVEKSGFNQEARILAATFLLSLLSRRLLRRCSQDWWVEGLIPLSRTFPTGPLPASRGQSCSSLNRPESPHVLRFLLLCLAPRAISRTYRIRALLLRTPLRRSSPTRSFLAETTNPSSMASYSPKSSTSPAASSSLARPPSPRQISPTQTLLPSLAPLRLSSSPLKLLRPSCEIPALTERC